MHVLLNWYHIYSNDIVCTNMNMSMINRICLLLLRVSEMYISFYQKHAFDGKQISLPIHSNVHRKLEGLHFFAYYKIKHIFHAVSISQTDLENIHFSTLHLRFAAYAVEILNIFSLLYWSGNQKQQFCYLELYIIFIL